MTIEAYEITEDGLEMYIGSFDNGSTAMIEANRKVGAGASVRFIAAEKDANGHSVVVDSWISN